MTETILNETKQETAAQQIVINPVTRIEGHAKITVKLDSTGLVEDARFHVTQVRGFEKFVEGRPFYEMPSLMARICGICPVSHLVASAKACDELMAVRIPDTAAQLRRLMNLAQIVQSHALSFFYLSSPDFLLGMDSDPATRNIIGLAQQHPEIAKDGVKLRKFGQHVIEILGGKRIHPAWIVPGGVNEPLSAEKRQEILDMLPEAQAIIIRTLGWFKRTLDNYRDEISAFANFPSLFMGIVGKNGELDHYHGKLRLVDSSGHIVADGLDPHNYADFIEEKIEPWTYLKFPYYKPMGISAGMYRVGPLARMNVINSCGTPLADQERTEFRSRARDSLNSSFHYHYARLIEILFAVESIQQILDMPDILSSRVRAYANPNNLEGIGVSEAPRGTLIHHYQIDEHGLMTAANLIIATGHNNLAMNQGVLQVARRFISGTQISEGILNRIEAVIRAFDPCLSCSTHAAGQMPLHVELLGPDGELLDEVRR